MVVVDNFNVFRTCARPHKTNAVSVVYAYAVLASPIALQDLEMIARRNAQIAQRTRDFQLPQLPSCHILERNESGNTISIGQHLSFFVFERNDHVEIVTYHVTNVKRY